MTQDTTANDAPSIETQQGCCSDGTTNDDPTGIETQQSCCGDGTADDGPTEIETQQGCCSGETTTAGSAEIQTRQESSCCGDSGSGGSSCGDDAGDASRKSPAEQASIREAAEHTEALLAEMAAAWEPDWTEVDVTAFLHQRMDETGVDAAWSRDYCPTVNAGADADVGHTLARNRTLPAGELLHVDFGVTADGYAADLQRVYYYPGGPDASVPDDLRTAFEDVRAAVHAGLDVLEPDTHGFEVDAAARAELSGHGWSEFNHAFGHQVGRDAHDGGTLLGPPWDRYGDRPRGQVQTGEVYSVELGVGTTYGYVGQEEMVRVVENGYEFVVEPQTDLRQLDTK